MNSQKRQVLLPLGRSWPTSTEEAWFPLEELLGYCGADTTLMLEAGEKESVETFLSHHAGPIKAHKEPFIIALSGAHSVGHILSTWGWAVGEFPFLTRALWILFINDALPDGLFLSAELEEHGSVDRDMKDPEQIVVWKPRVSPSLEFLVIRTKCINVDFLRKYSDEHFPGERLTVRAAETDPPSSAFPKIPVARVPSITSVTSSGLRLQPPYSLQKGNGEKP